MSLSDLQSQVNTALKAGDAVRVQTLRFLVSAAKNNAINKYGAQWEANISDADITDAVKKLVKTHKESVEAFHKAGRPELVQKEEAELKILEEFAPKELSDSELEAIVHPIAAEGGEFGPMMGKAMKAVAGRADGSRVSAALRKLTS